MACTPSRLFPSGDVEAGAGVRPQRSAGGGPTVRRFLAGQGCTEKEQTACDLSLVEACNNAIKYADGDARRKAGPRGMSL